jgi:hypothetical protein
MSIHLDVGYKIFYQDLEMIGVFIGLLGMIQPVVGPHNALPLSCGREPQATDRQLQRLVGRPIIVGGYQANSHR